SQILIAVTVVVTFLAYKEYSQPKTEEKASLNDTNKKYDDLGEVYLGKNLPEMVHDIHSLNEEFFNELDTDSLQGPLFMIRFAEVHCSSCMIRDINLLKDYIPKKSWDNILMIASYDNEDYFKLFARMHDLENQNIYRVDSHFLDVDKQLKDAPYYMILDEDLEIKEFFISSKFSDKRTEVFFENLFNTYKI
ncbi:MAG: hypothetical protein ABJH44_08695, partial [Balneola sp.]